MTSTTNSIDSRSARSERVTAVWPAFRCHDAHALIAYLTDVLGFTANVVHAEGDLVAHAQLSWPDGGGIMLGSERPAPEGEPDQQGKPQPGVACTYLFTSDLDAVHERVQSAGSQIVRPLGDTDYGSREFTCLDPEGNTWSIGDYAGEPPSGAS